MDTRSNPPTRGAGAAIRRVEDHRFLTGRGQYVDDIVLPRMAHAVVVMSSYPHARILSVDTSQALAAPGVLCVLTGADAQAAGLGGLPPLFMPEDVGQPRGHRTSRPLLVADKVRHVGDRVAFVVAETAAQARDAADLVYVDYEPLEAVVMPADAVKPGAPLIYDEAPGNVCCVAAFGDAEATRAAFRRAHHVVSLRLQNNRLTANSLEPRCAIGDYNASDESFTLYTSSQNPHGVRHTLAASVFAQPEARFRVISPDVGGGFGMKADAYPEDGLVLWASQRCGRPVKWIASRSDSLLGDTHGRDQVVDARMALDADGKILALEVDALQAVGAYVMSAAAAPLMFAVRFVPSVYDVRAYYGVNRGIFTNTSPTGPYRGAGRPEATYVIERLMDQAASELGIDRLELRRRNLIGKESMPYQTQTGFIYDSGDFHRLLAECIEISDWSGFAERQVESQRKGLLRGRALSFFIEQGGVFNDQMGLRLDPSGTATIIAGTHSHGQGHATVFSQLVADWLGIPMGSVRFVQGDTDKVPYGRGTYAARSSMIGGSALRLAADQLISQGSQIAAHLMQTEGPSVRFEDGVYYDATSDRRVTIVEVARAAHQLGGMPASFGVGLQATATWSADPPNFPNGCHACEVEVDPHTGVVSIAGYSAVDDVGKVLNPMICEGQMQGGIAQGIGQALIEHVIYDRESGQLLTGSFMDYGMPRAQDMPRFNLRLVEVACTTNPLGVKGVGEAGTIGAPPTVINAVLDALRPLGVQHIDMPASPLRVWEAIQEARA